MFRLNEFHNSMVPLESKQLRNIGRLVFYLFIGCLIIFLAWRMVVPPKLVGFFILVLILIQLFRLYPVLILLVSIVLSTHTLGLAVMSELPYFQYGPFRITMMDFLTIYMVVRLIIFVYTHRRELKLSPISKAIIMMFGVMFFSAGWSLFFSNVPLDDVLHGLRSMHGYLLYFVIVFLLKSRKEIYSYWRWIFVVVFISNIIELVEVGRGTRISWLPFKAGGMFLQGITSHTVLRAYTRVRAFFVLPLCLCLSSFFVRKRPVYIFWSIIAVVIALIPVVFGYTRAYYVFTIISLGTIVLLARGKSRLKVFFAVSGVISLFLLISWFGRIGMLPEEDYWRVTKERANLGIESFDQSTGTWSVRVNRDFPRIVEALKHNPLLGYAMDVRGSAEYSADSGIVSFVVRYGLLGIMSLLFMTVFFYRGVISILLKSDVTFYRILALGAAGAWAGMLVTSITLNWLLGSIPPILAGNIEFIRQRINVSESMEITD